MIRIVIADYQTLFRNMLETILSQTPYIEVVGSASSGTEAIELTIKHKPAILLMDIKMPESSGIHTLKRIKSLNLDTKVIMLTTFEDVNSITESCMTGADGYLIKDIEPAILIKAIECVHAGIMTFHKSAYDVICSQSALIHGTSKERLMFGDIILDGIDLRIIRCISEGMTNREIGQFLNYSEGTIKNRVSKMLGLTGLSDRTQISVFALKNNII